MTISLLRYPAWLRARFLQPRLILAAGLLLFSNVGWSEIYRWIDKNGEVRFSDSLPPSAAKLERHVLDGQGNLRDVLRRQRTVEELEQHRLRSEAMSTEAEQRARQEQYDEFLRTTFNELREIEALRQERLEIRDGQIATLSDDIQELKRRIVREQARKWDSAVAQQNLLRALEEELRQTEASVNEVKTIRQREFEGLNKDAQRFEFLRLKRAMHAAPRIRPTP